MRLFVAIDLEETIRQRIVESIESLRPQAPRARWQKPESLHITLKFLGETAADCAQQLERLLAGVRHSPVTIRFAGTGFFPTPKSPRVFWAGVEGGEALASLAAAVDEAASHAGFEREQRAFRPHLTLARASGSASGNPHQQPGNKKGGNLGALAQQAPAAQPDFGTMTAHEFYLYESKLSPAGARYSKIARFPLE